MYPAYVLKHNSNREKQVILLMIPNGEGWHYALLRRITSKHCNDLHYLNCLYSFRPENKPKSHKRVCEK